MCRHCEKLNEDKDFVHRFMELTANRINEAAALHFTLTKPITADDIDIRYEVKAEVWHDNPLARMYGPRLMKALNDAAE
jgi:hypothetical protein